MTDRANDVELNEIADRAVEALNAILGDASPGSVFSEPIQAGDALLITAAAWERGGGFGMGRGGGTDEEGATGGGSGVGGGAGSTGRPVAVIRVTSSGVQVTPVLDFTKIGVTLMLGAFGVWRVLRK